jgi:hypothetical protein
MDILDSKFNFNLLSLKDLLEARELFHLHLINKKNVVATALGRYRIRKVDPWPNEPENKLKVKNGVKETSETIHGHAFLFSLACGKLNLKSNPD